MDLAPLFAKLEDYGIFSDKDYREQAFSRNIGIFSPQEQEKIAGARVGIPGMGGVGSVHLMTMVRTGVGNFHISDFDEYEPVNVNRQFGARVGDFGRPKMEVMKKEALSVNPYLNIRDFPEGINKNTVDEFLEGVDVVLDSLDFFAFDVRRLLFNRARERGVHVITAGPLGFSSAMLVFAPDKGMGFDEYFNIVEGMAPEDKHLAFALGLAPKGIQLKYMDTSKVSLKSGEGPSLNIGCQLCAAMAGTEAIRILLNRGRVKPVPHYVQFDPYARKYCHKKLNLGNRHPMQKIKSILAKKMLENNIPIGPVAPEIPSISASGDPNNADVMDYIIQAGIQAPSGDNAQPWKFSRQENEISLYVNEDADRSFFNVNQLASIISCGAVIENMVIAASRFSFAADVKYPQNDGEKVATLTFIKNDELAVDKLADVIWYRNTNRKRYEKEPVPPGMLEELQQCIQGIPGAKIHFVTDREKLKTMAQLVSQADRIRTERQDLHEFLFQMIRYTKDETLEKKDGFYIKNLEAGIDGELFLKATKSWSAMNLANKMGVGRLVAKVTYDAIVNSSGVALVTTEGKTRTDFLKGGRALERVWLELTRAKFKVQPVTAITLFFLRKQLEGDKKFSTAHARMLDTIWKSYEDLFPNQGLETEGQVMLLRFGRAPHIRYGTLRREQEALMTRSTLL